MVEGILLVVVIVLCMTMVYFEGKKHGYEQAWDGIEKIINDEDEWKALADEVENSEKEDE